MNASRILPDLQCSLLCEDVRREASGAFILIGVVNYIFVPQVPIVAGRVLLFNRWTAGVGRFVESARILAPDQTTILHKHEVKFELQAAMMNWTNVTAFAPVEFKTAGVYYVEVMVDDVLKLRYPVVVQVVPPPNAGAQSPEGAQAAS